VEDLGRRREAETLRAPALECREDVLHAPTTA
jgi:hypothetical protein